MSVKFANVKKDEIMSGRMEIRTQTEEGGRGYGNLYGYGVRYYVDYQLVHEEFYKPGCDGKFSYELDTTAFENGEHLISIGTCDHNDHVGSATIKVIFNN